LLAGCCNVPELPLELLAELDEFELDELSLPELLLFELPLAEFDEFDEPGEPLSDVTAACVEPGSTATTMPAAATEANDTVMVVAFRRRLPCSRSATARAIWRAAAYLASLRARARARSLPVDSSRLSITLSLTRAAATTDRRTISTAYEAQAVRDG